MERGRANALKLRLGVGIRKGSLRRILRVRVYIDCNYLRGFKAGRGNTLRFAALARVCGNRPFEASAL